MPFISLAINKENHDTTACCGPVPKEPILPLGAYLLAYIDSGLPEAKIIYGTSPGPGLATDATPNVLRFGRAQSLKTEPLGFPENLRGARARRTRCHKDGDCGPPPEEHPTDDPADFPLPSP